MGGFLGMHKFTWKLSKLAFLKSKVMFGLFLAISLSLLTFFLILPFSSQTLAQAPQTKISLTNKDYPTTNLIIGYPNGNEVTALIKVSDVTDTDGLAGFAFKIGFDKTTVSVVDNNNDGIADQDKVQIGSFLTSSGKQSACSDAFLDKDLTNPNKIWLTYSCVTLGLTPSAPTGSGNLATVKFKPGPNSPSETILTLAETELVDNTQSANLIAHTTQNITLAVMRCANFDGVGVVDLFNDILGELGRWNMTSSNPLWDPKYYLDNNGNIDLFNDIIGTILQWNMECTP